MYKVTSVPTEPLVSNTGQGLFTETIIYFYVKGQTFDTYKWQEKCFTNLFSSSHEHNIHLLVSVWGVYNTWIQQYNKV